MKRAATLTVLFSILLAVAAYAEPMAAHGKSKGGPRLRAKVTGFRAQDSAKGSVLDEKVKAVTPDNVNIADFFGQTLLMQVCQRGTLSQLKKLLAMQETDVNAENQKGNTAFLYAAQREAPQFVQAFLRLKKDRFTDESFNHKNQDGETALMLAVGHKRVFDELLKHHPIEGDINDIKDKNDTTLLIRAAEGGSAEVVRDLLAKGAKIDAKNKFKVSALRKAIEKNRAEVVDVLVENVHLFENPEKDFFDALSESVWMKGRGEIALKLVDAVHMDLNQKKNGLLVLVEATKQCNMELAMKLVGKGANPKLEDAWGKTALSFADGCPGLQEYFLSLDK